MKKIVIILSLIISAFVMACSDGTTRIQTKAGVGSQKTLEDLEKASSEQELSKLKKQLEENPSTEVADVIRAVKQKFGARAVQVRPKNEQLKDKNGKKRRILESPAAEEKISASPVEVNLSEVFMVENDNPSNAVITKANNNETIHICVKSCDTQIIVNKKMSEEGKLKSVDVFVAHEINKENVSVSNSSLKNKDIKSILALYSVKGDKMLLTFSMTKSSKALIFLSEEFIYDEAKLPIGKIISADNDESGNFQVMKNGNVKTIRLDLDIEKDIVIIRLNNDSGLFGKNIKAVNTESKIKSSEEGMDSQEKATDVSRF